MIVYSNQVVLKYLLSQKEAKLRLIHWILLLQEFNLEICYKEDIENLVVDHLNRLTINEKPSPLQDNFPIERLFSIQKTTP